MVVGVRTATHRVLVARLTRRLHVVMCTQCHVSKVWDVYIFIAHLTYMTLCTPDIVRERVITAAVIGCCSVASSSSPQPATSKTPRSGTSHRVPDDSHLESCSGHRVVFKSLPFAFDKNWFARMPFAIVRQHSGNGVLPCPPSILNLGSTLPIKSSLGRDGIWVMLLWSSTATEHHMVLDLVSLRLGTRNASDGWGRGPSPSPVLDARDCRGMWRVGGSTWILH